MHTLTDNINCAGPQDDAPILRAGCFPTARYGCFFSAKKNRTKRIKSSKLGKGSASGMWGGPEMDRKEKVTTVTVVPAKAGGWIHI